MGRNRRAWEGPRESCGWRLPGRGPEILVQASFVRVSLVKCMWGTGGRSAQAPPKGAVVTAAGAHVGQQPQV